MDELEIFRPGDVQGARDLAMLDAMPSFSYSMPVQLVVLSVVLTLLSVLMVHLLFTFRYHFPLSKVNYIFQVTAVTLTMASIIGSMRILAVTLMEEVRVVPYMFNYIEVPVPGTNWSVPARVAWFALQMVVTMSVHATHIHFLTLLFPSRLEARLIMFLLVPLGLIGSCLYFTSLAPSDSIIDLGDAIRNVCNSTLTLLYTSGLVIWGLLVNRKRAWRTADGGTAMFGGMALAFGLMGTVVNFVEVREDRMRWLPAVVDAILLWQSWVSFWWWVGSGMWSGEAAEVEKKQAKKAAKAEARRLRREARKRAAGRNASDVASRSGRGVTESLSSLRRRLTMRPPGDATSSDGGGGIELQEMGGGRRPAAGVDFEEPGTSTGSNSSGPKKRHLFSPVVDVWDIFIGRLRSEHQEATAARAALPPPISDEQRRNWGLQGLTQQGRREAAEHRQATSGQPMPRSDLRDTFVASGSEALPDEADDAASSRDAASSNSPSIRAAARARSSRPRASAGNGAAQDDDWEDMAPPAGLAQSSSRSRRAGAQEFGGRGMEDKHGWWWRGIVGRWRLKDVTHY